MSTATHSSSGSHSSTKSESAPKKATKSDIEELIARSPVTSPVPAGLNDRRADSEPILGQFVEVTKGEHEGDYGVFLELQGTDAVLRLRDETGQRVVVPVTSLKASRAGKR
jgi:hypothetical protein